TITIAGSEPNKGHGTESSSPVKVSLTYNPAFDTPTGRQRPDVGLSIKVDGWSEPFEVILDAKYRLDTSSDYVKRHGSAGPPEDAVNVLHRYRDAILVSTAPGMPRDRRAIIVGAALFPLQDCEGEFEQNTFYRTLEQVGIGALPFLPSRLEYVKDLLRQLLTESGWPLADRVLDHRAAMERADWVNQAIQPVLVAVI